MTRDVAIPPADIVVTSADLHDDLRVRRYVAKAVRRAGDVVAWGGPWHRRPNEAPGIVEYAASAAACAYKHQALLAANDRKPRQHAAIETFHQVRAASARRSRPGGLEKSFATAYFTIGCQ
jgi:hypothetical protein